jgi:uncharacterized membrane protein YozB (DUF420 family)
MGLGSHLAVAHPTTTARVALVIIVLTAVLFTIGWRLARKRHFGAHRWVQTVAVILTTVVGLAWMLPSLSRNILPHIPARLGQGPYLAAVVHAVPAAIAVALGLYVVLGASKALPRSLSFTRFKPFMRASYALYMLAALTGLVLYIIAYVGP